MSEIIRASALTPRPWPNGLGVTRDVWERRGLLISIADLSQTATFSHFPDCDRIFTLIEGDTVELQLDGRAAMACLPFLPQAFPGDVPTTCVMPPGLRRAFNVFAPRTGPGAQVLVLRIAEGHRVKLGAVLAVHCVSGTLAVGTIWLEDGDTAIEPDEDMLEAIGGAALAVLVIRVGDV
jgi:environmental stress-induced protein Ves